MKKIIQMKQVEVLFPIKQQLPYSYRLNTRNDIDLLGYRVVAPLRAQAMVGMIVGESELNDDNTLRLKEITEIVDDKPFLPGQLIQLLFFISNYYANSAGETLKFLLPNKTNPRLDRELSLAEDPDWDRIKDLVGKSSTKYEIIQLLRKEKKIRFRTLQQLIGKTINQQINELISDSAISSTYNIKEAEIRELKVKFLLPAKTDKTSELRKNAHAQQLILTKLSELDDAIEMNLFRQIYNVSLASINSLSEKGLIDIEERVIERKSYHDIQSKRQEFPLTEDQEQIVDQLCSQLNTFSSHLLYGITGSGKTFVYIDVLKHVFASGKNAIVLIPEIALTAQTVTRFKSVFGDSIAVLHSKMTDGERFDAWRLLKDGRYRIAIGPRSAILAPLENIGLIIVDEEHDWSYKQSEQVPRFNARDLAIFRAKQSNCPIILGSATPSTESYRNALSGKYQLHELLERPVNIQSPELIIVDLKEELKQYPVKEHMMLSSKLSTAIEKCLTFNEQVILFQNKRGYSSYLHCVDCGQITDCPNCSISLVYHKADNQLICHFCGYKEAISNKCPSCKSENLKLSGFGTQKIEEMLHQQFPHARVMRMDSDTTRKKDGHRLILQQFESGEVDILIGTQMISKGLDFPNVTLVGVLNADLSLSIPDFRAAERSFQLISQVAGRAGRGEKAGHVIIQTFQPDHYAVQAAVANNFKQFYAIESHLRQDIFYPPFSRLINIRISSENEGQVFESISEFSNQLNRLIGDSIDLLGPVPCPIERINRKYRWQLLLKIKSSVDSPQFELKQKLMHVKEFLLKKFNSIHVAIDVDPYDLI